MKFIGLQTYSQAEIDSILKMDIDGVVIGDILCNKKMFEFGGIEIPDILKRLKDGGKKVIYQTPMYATDRIFDNLISNIKYYYSLDAICAVIVQDVGVANKLHAECIGLELIWGRMGYARNPITNMSTLEFYKRVGISAVECKDMETFHVAEARGFKPYLLIGAPVYNTINRECYYKYEYNIFDGDCHRGCLDRHKMIIPAKEHIETTIDGYVLGFENNYISESIENAHACENVIIYATNLIKTENILEQIG